MKIQFKRGMVHRKYLKLHTYHGCKLLLAAEDASLLVLEALNKGFSACWLIERLSKRLVLCLQQKTYLYKYMQKLCRKFSIIINHLSATWSGSIKLNVIFRDKFLIHNHITM